MTLQKAQHQNIVKVHELCESDQKFYCVMELIEGGNLTSLLNNKAMPEVKARYIVNQLVKTFNYLHNTLEIVHRDIKPDNVLFERPITADAEYSEEKVRVKLTDFGFATFFNQDTTTVQVQLGTQRYMAPEIIKRQ